MFVIVFIVFGLGLLNSTILAQLIPTKQEQTNLLLNVQEVFDQVKLLTKDEANATDHAVTYDVKFMVERAEYILELLKQATLLRLSCTSNSVCMQEFRSDIQQLAQEGRTALATCISTASTAIEVNSAGLRNVTEHSIDRGEMFLNSLENCSKKSGLAVISCYRTIILTDTIPVKRMMLKAIEAHKDAHFKSIDIRFEAGVCIDDVVAIYRE